MLHILQEVEQSFAPSQITGDQSLPVYQQPPPGAYTVSGGRPEQAIPCMI